MAAGMMFRQPSDAARRKESMPSFSARELAQPTEGDSVRSRLWSLILNELPFPFRQIGMEIAQLLGWLDQTSARVWVGLHRSPGWYCVTVAGCVTLMLTALLFFPFIVSHDPTLGELANEGASRARVTRATLERSGDWSAQDRWRVAHLFVDHRPPRKLSLSQLDSRLVEEHPLADVSPRERVQSTSRSTDRNRTQREASQRLASVQSGSAPAVGHSVRREPDVRLELDSPSLATQSRRLVYGPLIREPGVDFDAAPRTSPYRPRNTRLQVQAEWAAGADCREEYEPRRSPLVRRDPPPVRREISVPEPQWDEPRAAPIARVQRHPDLSFEMELLREFLPGTSEFPPKSRSKSVAARSEFPESFAHVGSVSRANRSTSHTGQMDRWIRSTSHVEHQPRPEAYISRLSPDGERDASDEVLDADGLTGSDESGAGLPSFAEVALRLELTVPENVIAGRVHSSSLHIRNEGSVPVTRVRVHESLAELQTVTDAKPDGRVHDDLLERDVIRLLAGRDQQLSVEWLPNEEGSQVHRAVVTMHAAVGATNNVVAPEPAAVSEPPRIEPEPFDPELLQQDQPVPADPVPAAEPSRNPAISCDVKHVNRTTVDEIVELQIVVKNTGDTPLHDVRIGVGIPAELKHRRGDEVEYEVGNLARRGSHTCVLRLMAQLPGDAISHIQVVTRELVEAKARSVIVIEANPVARATPPLPEVIPRTTPKPAPKPTTKSAPFPTSGGCCCPGHPVALLEQW